MGTICRQTDTTENMTPHTTSLAEGYRVNLADLICFTLNLGTQDDDSRKLTIMLVFTGIFYIVCVTPGAIFIAAKDIWNGGNTAYTFSSGKEIVNPRVQQR